MYSLKDKVILEEVKTPRRDHGGTQSGAKIEEPMNPAFWDEDGDPNPYIPRTLEIVTDMKSPASVCLVCQNLEAPSKGDLHISRKKLADFEAARDSGCSFCAILHAILEVLIPPDRRTRENPMIAYHDNRTQLEVWFRHLHFDIYQPANDGCDWIAPKFPRWTVISSHSGSSDCMQFAKFCLERCVEEHELCRQSPDSFLPTRVIHLSQDNSLRLIEPSENTLARYAALSYCWGDGLPISTTKATLETKKEGIAWDLLPATLQDAVTVTRSLGLEYLWVDCLCIIQDSLEDWELESSKMANVYAGAHITIAAASSKSCSIPFLQPRPTEYNITANVKDKSGDAFLLKVRRGFRPPKALYYIEGVLNSRGWAYQERVLSPRVLSYLEAELIWTCRMERRCECQHHDASTKDARSNTSLHSEAKDVPNNNKDAMSPDDPLAGDPFVFWQLAVRNYSGRALKYPSDTVPAIAGVGDIIQQRTGSRNLAGLWQDNLLGDL